MKIVFKLYKKHEEIVNYIIAGLLTTIVSLITYYVAVLLFLNPNKAFELQVANIISWIVSVTFAYYINRKFVFKSKNKKKSEILKFFISRLSTLFIDMLFMYLLVSKFLFNDKISKIVVQAAVIVLNYIFSKLFVFSKKRECKERNKNKENILFTTILLFIMFLGATTLIRNEKDISYTENRSLGKFPHLTISGYLSGEFQTYFSNAFSDQFLFSETVKDKMYSVFNIIEYNQTPKFICSNKYLSLSDTLNSFDCGDYILYGPMQLDDNRKDAILRKLKVYSQLNNYVDTYYYLIETPIIFDFETNSLSIDIVNIVKNNMSGHYNISYLPIKNYKNYMQNFYKTDHHWNYKGSYTAYNDIVKLVTNDKPLEPENTITFNDLYFWGSAARSTQIFDFKEKFTVYKFNYPNYSVKINGVDGQYGNEEKYFNKEYSTNKLINHYGEFYGGDDGEIVFNFNNQKKPNVLILGSSFTNSINKLIASHFNKTYVVDLRNYESSLDEIFDIKSYIDKNKITKVIIIADFNFLQDNEFDIEWRN